MYERKGSEAWEGRRERTKSGQPPVRKLDCSGRTAEKDASMCVRGIEGGYMRVLMKVTSANKHTDDKLLVQLQGQYGHASLILPIEQQRFVQVGDEWTLEHGEDGLHKIIGELDESFDNSRDAEVRMLSGETGSSSAGLDALAGKPQEP
jgi:hypothetical protein